MRIYIVVPSLIDTAPIKGAIALANGLVNYYEIFFVALMHVDNNVGILLNSDIKTISFAHVSKPWRKFLEYRKLVLNDKTNTVYISSCLSADIANWLVRKHVTIISSVRGNLLKNYFFRFGLIGYLLAKFHLRLLRNFDQVVAISKTMAKQLHKNRIKRIIIVGNFLDETRLRVSSNRASSISGSKIHFLFLARLVKIKRPELLIKAAYEIKKKNINFQISIVGDGFLRNKLERYTTYLGLQKEIIFYGHVFEPYNIIKNADYMILPSVSEGISRSILEALYLGIPCIATNTNESRELIKEGQNGFLFDNITELVEKMVMAYELFKPLSLYQRENLLPPFFSQEINIRKYMKVLDGYQ